MGLILAPHVEDFVRILAPETKRSLRTALDLIQKDPLHAKLDWKQLRKKGPMRFLRVKVGDYRIIYTPRPGTTFVWRIQHRREGYDWLERFDPPNLA